MRRTVIALIVVLVAGLGGCAAEEGVVGQSVDVFAFTPSSRNQDPSTEIEGVVVQEFAGGAHIGPQQRVAYTFTPPIGGVHDQAWAACNGVVYEVPVRSENLVHSMEHGAVWIAYDPDRVDGAALDSLVARVEGRPYLVLSPYPGMDQPISLQSWGHQLALTDAGDARIDQFVAALRQNQYTHPEPGAKCEEIGQGYFDQDAPPPFADVPAESEIDGQAVVAES